MTRSRPLDRALSRAVDGRDQCYRFEISIPETTDHISNAFKTNTGCITSPPTSSEFIFVVGSADVPSVGAGYVYGLTTSRVASLRFTLSDKSVVRTNPSQGIFLAFFRVGQLGPDIETIDVLDASDKPLRTCRKSPESGGIDEC